VRIDLQLIDSQDNIVFGAPFDEVRYKKGWSTVPLFGALFRLNIVLYQCALDRDISLFDAGDRTEVGEKGLTIRLASHYLVTICLLKGLLYSGGQKVEYLNLVNAFTLMFS
jgi:hypothetical protein